MLAFSRNIIFNRDPTHPEKTVIFNVASLLEGYRRLEALTPPREVSGFYMDPNDPNKFYELYKIYLSQNRDAMLEIMDIAYALYEGMDVILLIGADDLYRDTLRECIAKVFIERYGYLSSIIMDTNDIESIVDRSFAIWGLMQFDKDKEWYTTTQTACLGLNCGRSLDDYD